MLKPTLLKASLRDYLQVALSRKWYFLLPVIIVFPVVTTGSLFIPKSYSSEAIVEVSEPRTVNPLAERQSAGYQGPPPTMQERLMTVTEQVLTFGRLAELAVDLGLIPPDAPPVMLNETVVELQRRFRIEMKASNIFAITYTEKEPFGFSDRPRVRARVRRHAARVVNLLAQKFISDRQRRQMQSRLDSQDMLESLIRKYERNLDNSYGRIRTFREENFMAFTGPEQQYAIQQLIDAERRRDEISVERDVIAEQIAQIEAVLAADEGAELPESVIMLNPSIGQLSDRRGDLESMLSAQYASGTTDMHPRVLTLREEIGRVERQIADETASTRLRASDPDDPMRGILKDRVNSHRGQLEAANVRIQRADDEISKYRERVDSAPKVQEEFQKLYSGLETERNIYEALKLRFESESISGQEVAQLQGTQYRIIDPGRVPVNPAAPNVILYAIVSMMLSVMVGAVSVILAEATDRSLRNVEEAAKGLDLPVLAAIPGVKTSEELAEEVGNHRFAWALVVASTVCLLIGIIYGAVSGGPSV